MKTVYPCDYNHTLHTIPTPAPQLIANADLALVLEAVEQHDIARAALLYGLESGTLQVAHTGPDLPRPAYCKAGGEIDRTMPGGRGQELLVLALARAAGRWSAMGHGDDMADCLRLVARLRAGSLQLIGNHTAADMERWGR